MLTPLLPEITYLHSEFDCVVNAGWEYSHVLNFSGLFRFIRQFRVRFRSVKYGMRLLHYCAMTPITSIIHFTIRLSLRKILVGIFVSGTCVPRSFLNVSRFSELRRNSYNFENSSIILFLHLPISWETSLITLLLISSKFRAMYSSSIVRLFGSLHTFFLDVFPD